MYLLAALEHALDQVERSRGVGMRQNAAAQAAKNMHGFEIMVGPIRWRTCDWHKQLTPREPAFR